MHADLIGPYRKYIRQNQPGGAIIKNNVSITCLTIINPTIGWFEIVEGTMFDLNESTGGNGEYIGKSSNRVSQ